jgi:hypothetical protein
LSFFIALLISIYGLIGVILAPIISFGAHGRLDPETKDSTIGFFALVIIAVMAATSHDFSLSIISTGCEKATHVGVFGVRFISSSTRHFGNWGGIFNGFALAVYVT